MLSKGQVLRDRYRIERQIGSGGSSSVYLATDVSIGKKWAVKYLDCSDDTMWLAQNEINMMIRLDHVMFPRIVDAWQDAGGYVIVAILAFILGIVVTGTIQKAKKMKEYSPDSEK